MGGWVFRGKDDTISPLHQRAKLRLGEPNEIIPEVNTAAGHSECIWAGNGADFPKGEPGG